MKYPLSRFGCTRDRGHSFDHETQDDWCLSICENLRYLRIISTPEGKNESTDYAD
jgi:hypothetical protein